MSNHIHLIIKTENNNGLSSIIRDFKTFTSKEILKNIIENSGESRSEWILKLFKYHARYNTNNKNYQFWIQNNHPIELVTPKWINQKILYIHLNPVRAGLVDEPEYYKYSSAANYEGLEGVLDVEILGCGNGVGYVD